MVRLDFLEWSGAVTGLAGAALLSANNQLSGYGFAAFLVSNCFWIAFATKAKKPGLLMMQAGFTLTSIVGIYRWIML